MKLSELKIIPESKMSERHQDLQDAIMDEFGCDDARAERIASYLLNNDMLTDQDQNFLYDQFKDLHVGGDGDPSEAIGNKLEKMFSNELKGL